MHPKTLDTLDCGFVIRFTRLPTQNIFVMLCAFSCAKINSFASIFDYLLLGSTCLRGFVVLKIIGHEYDEIGYIPLAIIFPLIKISKLYAYEQITYFVQHLAKKQRCKLFVWMKMLQHKEHYC